MKQKLLEQVNAALHELKNTGVIASDLSLPEVVLVRSKHKQHGDFSCNIALMLAKLANMAPRDLAVKIIEKLVAVDFLLKTEVAGAGFINFYLKAEDQLSVVAEILNLAEDYGICKTRIDDKINVEFVSANPTGPLHVGHGRSAAYGSALVNLLKFACYDVDAEYYVNDAGRQMDILAVSVWLRYLEKCGIEIKFPVNAYQGDYVKDIAAKLHSQLEDELVKPVEEIFDNLPQDADQGGDKEVYIDALIDKSRELLGDKQYNLVHKLALDSVLTDIQADLSEFSVRYDNWFSEKSLVTDCSIQKAINLLKDKNLLYVKNNATWFKATEFGDDKDRVMVRDNGQTTYFASDAAYLLNKLDRGYKDVIYVFGADHHGYVPRLKALMQAFGFDLNRLRIPLVQFAVLYRGKEQVQMSTRSGSFVTLRELREEVGNDVARFFYVMRKCEQHLDFDLDLAKSQSNDNPVYYIQYAYARICSIFRQLGEKGFTYNQDLGLKNLELLDSDEAKSLLSHLAKFPDLLKSAATRLEPHLLAYYLRELAQLLHAFYNCQQVLVDDDNKRNANLCLLTAIKQAINNGMSILGVSTPERM